MTQILLRSRFWAKSAPKTRFLLSSGAVFGLALVFSACAGNSNVGAPPGPGGGGPATGAAAAGQSAAGEMPRLYRDMGLIAGTGTVSFVASVSFLTAPNPDTTLVLVALSMPSRSLGFTREGDRYVAEYSVRLEARRGPTSVRLIESKETVRVQTFRETSRTDESVIWQQYLRLAPGQYQLALGIKDESGIRTASEEVVLTVPRLPTGRLGSPVSVYEAIPRSSVDSLPRLLARPRSTVTYGVDSLIPIYLEAIGPTAPDSVQIRVLGEGDIELWRTSAELTPRLAVHSVTVPIPVARLGVGTSNIVVNAIGQTDTVRTKVLVSLGDDLPIATFEDMLGFLKYFATAERLKVLRDAPLEQRSAAWTTFLAETDPVPGTPEHEGLRDYFLRIRTANVRYRDDGQIGWQTDRGIAYVGLGDPDNVYDSGLSDPNARVRQQVWEYRALRVQLVFLDQTGFGRWRLAPSGRSELDNAIRRKLSGQP
jgi:GWxTD domain-containing protein